MTYPFCRLEIAIPSASGDGKYYGRYPQGNAPLGAGLSAAANDSTSATFALTTRVVFNGNAVDATTAAALLSVSQAQLAANALDTTSATGYLPLSIEGQTTFNGIFGQTNAIFINASGGVAPYSSSITSQTGLDSWSIASGAIQSIPIVPLIVYDSSGNFVCDSSGNAVTTGSNLTRTDTVSVQAQDALSETATATYTINIKTPITMSTPRTGTHGTAYSFQMTASGGTGPYTWKLINFSGSNTYAISTSGLLTGSPSIADTDVVSILCVDADNIPANTLFSIVQS